MAPSLRWATALATVAAVSARPTHEEYKAQKAEEKADQDAANAKEDKMAAVNKVIELLKDLKSTVLSEGEKEAASYNKFACFCKDMTTEKQDAIEKGEDDRERLSTDITGLADDRDGFDSEIEEFEEDIAEAEEFMEKKTKSRKEEEGVYQKAEADLSGAISAVEGALQTIKASKPSLLQVQASLKSVQKALLLADAMGLNSVKVQHSVAAFLQADAPGVPMEEYKFKSGKVIELLEDLHKDLRDQKNELDEEEVSDVNDYDKYMLDKNFEVKTWNMEMDRTKKKRADAIAEIAANSEMLTTTASTLLDDQQYLMELSEMCSDKSKTWDQRSQVRADELSALTSAIIIIEGEVSEKTTAAAVRFAQQGVTVRLAMNLADDPDRMNALEAAAEEADSFLQVAQKPRALLGFLQRHNLLADKPTEFSEQGRSAVVNVLNSAGDKIHSTLLTSLATQIAGMKGKGKGGDDGGHDPMFKVKTLIEELIGRLQQEAADEATQKGFCDKGLMEAEEKRDRAAEKIRELNTEMSGLENREAELTEEIADLTTEITETEEQQEVASKERKEEKAENEDSISVAGEGLDALKRAIQTLEDFYENASKEKVDLELMQKGKGPADDAPDSGFDGGDAYKGNGKSGGVLGMLDVIKSDFERTISETEKAEEQAEQDHTAFMDESQKAIDGAKDAKKEKNSSLDDTEESLESANEDMDSQTELLKTSLGEYLEMKKTCLDSGMSYEERVERREDEIQALKKGLCVLVAMGEPGGAENAAANC